MRREITVTEEQPIALQVEPVQVVGAVSPTVDAVRVESGVEITIHDLNGTETVELYDGEPGQDGTDGISPAVSVTEISGGHRVNVTDAQGTETFDVMDGEPGQDYVLTAQDKQDIADLAFSTVAVSGSTPVITAEANHRYVCGTVSTITFTPCASGLCDVLFRSGTSAAVLTVPSGLKWPDWFDPTALAASTVYELNVMDGIYGAVMAWAD